MIRQLLRMKRALSPSDELAVRDYYNRTADSLGIALPLSTEAWFQVKGQLRAMVSGGYPPEWPMEQVRLHAKACSDLVIDPLPERMGPVQFFLAWILSPADCHGRISELMRIFVLVSISWMTGIAFVSAIHSLGWTEPALGTIIGVSLCVLVMLGTFISSNTITAALGLQLAIGLACSIASTQADAHWLEVGASILGMIFGGFLFLLAFL